MEFERCKWKAFGAGIYQLKNKRTDQFVLFGRGDHLSHRMTSLLPHPYGEGTRKNKKKREYVWNNIDYIEYRTIACLTHEETVEIEREIRELKIHIFNS